MNISPEWKEWREVAESNGIKSYTFRKRIKKGMSPQKAATKLLSHVETEIMGGLTLDDYKTAEKNGISRQTAYYRYEMLYWDKETAITKKVGEDTQWKKWKAAAERIGISYRLFQSRRCKGMTPEEAATTPKRKGGRPRNEDLA